MADREDNKNETERETPTQTETEEVDDGASSRKSSVKELIRLREKLVQRGSRGRALSGPNSLNINRGSRKIFKRMAPLGGYFALSSRYHSVFTLTPSFSLIVCFRLRLTDVNSLHFLITSVNKLLIV